ncbi:ribulose-phosphate 3-epimerase [soil metagenome]
MRILLAASILSADLGSLAEQVRVAERGGADRIHVDVMDGRFVPNFTFGPPVTAAVRRATELPVDVHLMMEAPERYIGEFFDAGADRITVHQETCPHLLRTLQRIRELGAAPGVAINPATPLSTLAEILPFTASVLVMTVNPGFGGQAYIGTMSDKVIRLRRQLIERNLQGQVELQVDGGINADTAAEVVAAGATVLIAGSAVFGAAGGVAENLQRLRAAAHARSGAAG